MEKWGNGANVHISVKFKELTIPTVLGHKRRHDILMFHVILLKHISIIHILS